MIQKKLIFLLSNIFINIGSENYYIFILSVYDLKTFIHIKKNILKKFDNNK